MATIKITLIRDDITINGFVYRIDSILTVETSVGNALIANGDAILFVEPVLPDPTDCECHVRQHLMTDPLDHGAATGTDKNKILHSNASTGAIEWIATPPSGSGTLNYLPKWTPNGTTLGNSQIFDDGTNVGVGRTSGFTTPFDVIGRGYFGRSANDTGVIVGFNETSIAEGIESIILGDLIAGVYADNYKYGGLSASLGITIDGGNGKVGIKTDSITRDLDINGALRIRTITEQTSYPHILVSDNNGNVDYIEKSTFITAEADTLDTVTDRGNTTTNGITIGSIKITDSATNGYYLKCTNADGTAQWASITATDVYKGTWDASTNTPTLADGVGTSGWWYRCVVGGTVDFGNGNITFSAGDDVAYNGSIWQKRPGAAGYTLPTASTAVLGGVKIDGTTITINSGVISSHNPVTIATASNTTLGLSSQELSIDSDLIAIAGLAGTSGYLKKTGVNTWELDATVSYSVESETADTTCFPIFNTDSTGTFAPKSNPYLTYNSSSGLFTSKSLGVTDYVASVKLKVNLSVDAGLSSRNVASESIVQFGNNLTSSYTGTTDTSKAGAMLRLDTRNQDGGSAGACYTVIQFQTREANAVEGLYQVPFQICPAPTNSFLMRRTGAVELNYGLFTPVTITSTLAIGTKPLTVTSTTMCDNLNADLLDGYHYTHFAVATHTHAYLPLAGGTMNGNAGIVFVGAESGTDTLTMDWAQYSFDLTYYSTSLNTTFNVLSADINGNTYLGRYQYVSVDSTGKLNTSAFKLTTGAGLGKVLTSDADGDASWETLPSYTNYWKRTGTLLEPATTNDRVKSSNDEHQKVALFGITTGTSSTGVSGYAMGDENCYAVEARAFNGATALWVNSDTGTSAYIAGTGQQDLLVISTAENVCNRTLDAISYIVSSGNPSAGIGLKSNYYFDIQNTSRKLCGSVEYLLTDVTSTSEDGKFIWKIVNNGTVEEKMSLTNLGNLTISSVKITTGAGLGKVLTSDADGDATWETASSGSNWNYASNEYTPLGTGDTFTFETTQDTAVVGWSTHESGIGIRGLGYYGVNGESSGGYAGYFYATSTAMPLYLQDSSTNNLGFVYLIGGTAANFTESVSSIKGDGAVTAPKRADAGGSTYGWYFEEMIRVKVNGNTRWIPCYSSETSA